MTEPTLIFTDGRHISDKKDSDAEAAREERARRIEEVIANLNILTAAAVLDAQEAPHRMIHPTPEPSGAETDPWATGELGCSRDPSEPVIDISSPEKLATSRLAQRFNSGKPELHYLLTFPEAMRGIARVTTYGSKKYALYNYTKGAPASESVSCALRHLLAWFSGEDTDPESGLCHLDAFVWNAARLTHEMATRPDLDNRPHVLMKQSSEADKT